MTKISWKLYNNRTATYYQDIILSASYQYGRQAYLDNYSGQSISITIKNQANESANFQLNDWIGLTGDLGIYQAYNQSFWVTAIDYEDYPGNIGLSTATITASDAMHRLGRVLGKSDTLSAGTTGAQIESMDTKSSWPPDITTFSFNTSSQASAATVTQSWNNQINLLQTTEKGILAYSSGRAIRLQGRAHIQNMKSTISLTRTATATNIGYQTFSRLGYGQTFVNSAEITPAGLGTSTGTNTASITLYGQNGITQSTVDADATQAQGNADWTARALSDPTVLRFECGFNDLLQNETVLKDFLQAVTGNPGVFAQPVNELVYRVPGAGSDTTVTVLVEGWSLNITPEQTNFNFYLSPLTYYQFFTLNSSVLGILDTSRLGW